MAEDLKGGELAEKPIPRGQGSLVPDGPLAQHRGFQGAACSGGTVKLSEKDEFILGLGLDQASLAIPVTSAQT